MALILPGNVTKGLLAFGYVNSRFCCETVMFSLLFRVVASLTEHLSSYHTIEFHTALP